MTLMEPISVARPTDKASREGTRYGQDAYNGQRRRPQSDGSFAAALAQAMRR